MKILKLLLASVLVCAAAPARAQSPTSVVITDANGKALAVTGVASAVQVGSPVPVVITDVNGKVIALGGSAGITFVAANPALCTPGTTGVVELNVAPYTVSYCSATNTWTAIGAGSGGSGCVPIGAAGDMLTDSGAGSCNSSADFILTSHTLAGGASAILDLHLASATAGFKVPVAAGAIPTVDGIISLNSTNHTIVWGSNGTTLVPAIAATGTGTATTCTNQAVTAISAIAVPTCTTVSNAMLANSAITIAGTSVSLGGSTSSLPSPGAIGGGTPAAITGTTITANTSLVINAGTAQTGTQGTDTKLMTAGTVAGTAATLCTDASGGATTSGCTSSGFSNPMTTPGDLIQGGTAGAAARLAVPTPPTNVSDFLCNNGSTNSFCVPGVAFDAQTAGSPYTIPSADRSSLITITNASAYGVTLPQSGASNFGNNFNFALANLGAGLVTVTPTTSHWNGNTSQIVPTHFVMYGYGNNTDYVGGVFPDIAAFPSCSSTGNALGFTSATGAFSCFTGYAPLVSPSFTTPTLGAAVATSLLATGIVDGTAPITITTATTATLGAATYQSGYTLNQEATAGTGVTYTLPATAVGKQYCVANSGTTSIVNTGVLTVYPPSSSFVILNGVVNTVGGGGTHGVASGGAAGDAACFVAIDATHWQVWVGKGTWTEN